MANQTIYPQTSPYYSTGVVSNKYLDVMVGRPFPNLPSDIYITLNQTYEYRPDMLAYDLYNDARLWWVFAARNPNRLGPDPYFNFKAGIGIYVPTIDTLKTFLGI